MLPSGSGVKWPREGTEGREAGAGGAGASRRLLCVNGSPAPQNPGEQPFRKGQDSRDPGFCLLLSSVMCTAYSCTHALHNVFFKTKTQPGVPHPQPAAPQFKIPTQLPESLFLHLSPGMGAQGHQRPRWHYALPTLRTRGPSVRSRSAERQSQAQRG